MKEIKSNVTFEREETFKDGKKHEDYMTVRYYPNEENKWSYTSFTISTSELEHFAKAIMAEVSKLKDKETQYKNSLVFGTNMEINEYYVGNICGAGGGGSRGGADGEIKRI